MDFITPAERLGWSTHPPTVNQYLLAATLVMRRRKLGLAKSAGDPVQPQLSSAAPRM
ncbi:MAG: hypothetical protein ACE5IZ_08605 [Dehalococcoidia bacterium]